MSQVQSFASTLRITTTARFNLIPPGYSPGVALSNGKRGVYLARNLAVRDQNNCFMLLNAYNLNLYIYNADTDNIAKNSTITYAAGISGAGNEFDYNDSTGASLSIAAGRSNVEVARYDFGSVAERFIYVFVYADVYVTTKAQISNDGTTWTDFISAVASSTASATASKFDKISFRYVRVIASNSDTAAARNAGINTLEVLDPAGAKVFHQFPGAVFHWYKIKMPHVRVNIILEADGVDRVTGNIAWHLFNPEVWALSSGVTVTSFLVGELS